MVGESRTQPTPVTAAPNPAQPGTRTACATHAGDRTAPLNPGWYANRPAQPTRVTDRGTQPKLVSELHNPATEPSEAKAQGGAGGGAPACGKRSAAAQNDEGDEVRAFRGHTSPIAFVDDTGIEPVTSSVSGKRATAAPIVRETQDY